MIICYWITIKVAPVDNMTITVRCIFEEDGKFYFYLDECLYEV